jgi:RNA polymerase sigma factor (sigma-70 family)
VRNDDDNYRKLMLNLTRKAASMGARDPEGAAHEALTRALKHPLSRSAVEAQLEPQLPALATAAGEAGLFSHPELLAWLHVVLFNVVSEERSRASYRRERFAFNEEIFDVADPSPNQLDALLREESHHALLTSVRESVATLSDDWRRVLQLRAQGLKQTEIAERLGVPRATVATWTRRALQRLTQLVRSHPQAPGGHDGSR